MGTDKMKIVTAALGAGIVAFATIGCVLGTAAAPAQCPKVEVSPEYSDIGSGVMRFTVAPASDKLNYNWTVSAGTISSGQGTSQIIVEASSGDVVKAIVIVGGLPKGCPGEAEAEVMAP